MLLNTIVLYVMISGKANLALLRLFLKNVLIFLDGL